MIEDAWERKIKSCTLEVIRGLIIKTKCKGMYLSLKKLERLESKVREQINILRRKAEEDIKDGVDELG